MNLSIPVLSDFFEMSVTSPTVLQPGAEVKVALELAATQPVVIRQLRWDITGELHLEPLPPAVDLPVRLPAGGVWRYEQLFTATTPGEQFGEIRGEIAFQSEAGTEAILVEWTHWVSIFQQKKADESAPLSDELRDRLIGVTNARPQNGHIFLADTVRYFADYLNILIHERLAAILAREFGLPDEGLPVTEEVYLRFCRGQMTFYGIKVLELIAEEDCNESDDRLDLNGIRETIPTDVDLNT